MTHYTRLLLALALIAGALAVNFNEAPQEPLFDGRVPVISLNDFYHPEKRKQFVQTLGKAFEEHGFAAVIDADINPIVLDNAYRGMQEFFTHDMEYKQAIQSKTNNGERGYVTDETPKRQPLHVVDFKEILHIGRELTPEQQSRLGYAANIWPAHSPLKQALMPLYSEMERVMQPIAEAASEYIGEAPQLFPEMMHEGDHLLRSLHYLRQSGEKRNWAAEHTDMNFLTLIPGGSSEGLQVRLKDGRWVDILVPKNAVVVNVGDSLEHLTNGFYRSGVHRVVAKAHSEPERWSIVFHGHTRHNLEMGPLPGTIAFTGGVPRYPNAKGWELLYEQIAAVGRATRPMLEQLAASGVMERKIAYGQASEKVMRILGAENLASPEVLAELNRIDTK